MSNLEKYVEAFKTAFEIEEGIPDLKYQQISQWDSVGHMRLMTLIEESFDIMLETEDMLDFDSFEHGKSILKEKYDVDI